MMKNEAVFGGEDWGESQSKGCKSEPREKNFPSHVRTRVKERDKICPIHCLLVHCPWFTCREIDLWVLQHCTTFTMYLIKC